MNYLNASGSKSGKSGLYDGKYSGERQQWTVWFYVVYKLVMPVQW